MTTTMKKIYTYPVLRVIEFHSEYASMAIAPSGGAPEPKAPSRVGAPVRRVSVLGSVPTLK